MGNKKISISDEAYLWLSELKYRNEIFTDVIYRLTSRTNVNDLNGIINEEEGKSLEENIKKSRKLSKERIDGITRELNEL
jgi:predicted CopG family antitoxin